MRYTVQQHGEWSETDAMDIDFEADTWEDVERIIRDEIPPGVIYLVIDNVNQRVYDEGIA